VLPVVSVPLCYLLCMPLCYVRCMRFGVDTIDQRDPLVYALLYSTRMPCGSKRRQMTTTHGGGGRGLKTEAVRTVDAVPTICHVAYKTTTTLTRQRAYTQVADEDFCRALEHGLPPTAGWSSSALSLHLYPLSPPPVCYLLCARLGR